jgi:hypothetical protein
MVAVQNQSAPVQKVQRETLLQDIGKTYPFAEIGPRSIELNPSAISEIDEYEILKLWHVVFEQVRDKNLGVQSITFSYAKGGRQETLKNISEIRCGHVMLYLRLYPGFFRTIEYKFILGAVIKPS